MSSSRYRPLKKSEIPDRSKGDQVQDINRLWILVSSTYTQTVGQILAANPKSYWLAYRRPKELRETDLHESTATCG
jgi:hypothetical protein